MVYAYLVSDVSVMRFSGVGCLMVVSLGFGVVCLHYRDVSAKVNGIFNKDEVFPQKRQKRHFLDVSQIWDLKTDPRSREGLYIGV